MKIFITVSVVFLFSTAFGFGGSGGGGVLRSTSINMSEFGANDGVNLDKLEVPSKDLSAVNTKSIYRVGAKLISVTPDNEIIFTHQDSIFRAYPEELEAQAPEILKALDSQFSLCERDTQTGAFVKCASVPKD